MLNTVEYPPSRRLFWTGTTVPQNRLVTSSFNLKDDEAGNQEIKGCSGWKRKKIDVLSKMYPNRRPSMISSSTSGPPTTRKESVTPPNADGVRFQGSPLSLGLRAQARTLWVCQVKEQAEQKDRGHPAYFRTLTESYPTLQKK